MIQQNQSHILMYRPHLLNLLKADSLPDGYTLRAFTANDDWQSLALTLSLAFNSPWNEATVRSKLIDAPDVKAIYIVTWRGYTVATASSRWLPMRFPQSGYVHWVGTHPEHRGLGLASALLTRILQDFLDRQYKDAILETDDFRIPAVKTYLKFGFIPVYTVGEEDHRSRWSSIFQEIFDH